MQKTLVEMMSDAIEQKYGRRPVMGYAKTMLSVVKDNIWMAADVCPFTHSGYKCDTEPICKICNGKGVVAKNA